MASVVNWLVNKLRFRRNALSTSTNVLSQFAIYYGTYSNWKTDPRPMIFIMHSDKDYTHGINVHYLSRADKAWFARALQLMKKGGQQLTGLTMYRLLKMRRYSIVQTAYRLYFTSLLDMKMVSAGLTPYYKLVYANVVRDSWLMQLNKMIMPESIDEAGTPPQVAFGPNELENRINTATNAQSIQSKTVSGAPYRRKAPYSGGGKAPWAK